MTAGQAFDELLDHWQRAEQEHDDVRETARQVRADLVWRVIPGLAEHLATVSGRLEELPGWQSSKWQLTRIRAEARQEEVRRSGHPSGDVNDYIDVAYKHLARSNRRSFRAMHRFFPELAAVADRTLTVEERSLVGALVGKLAELESLSDDLEYLRLASAMLPEWRYLLQDFGAALELNLGSGSSR